MKFDSFIPRALLEFFKKIYINFWKILLWVVSDWSRCSFIGLKYFLKIFTQVRSSKRNVTVAVAVI